VLEKKIKYVDYEGIEREEVFRFNISKVEVAELEVSKEGGFVKFIEKITEEKDAGELLRLFKEVILLAYGEKTPDGKRFIKSKELSEAFSQTEAFVELYMELSSDADKAVAFFNGVLPKKI
jgi:hypothetical protein